MIAKRALCIFMIPVISHAMDNQNSPRIPHSLSGSSGLSSPRLDRSGSNSDIAKAAVAHATLKRVVTPDKLNALKRSGSLGCITSRKLASSCEQSKEGGSTEASPVITPREQKLVDLRESLRRSRSPHEEGEAHPVFCTHNEEGMIACAKQSQSLRAVVSVPVGVHAEGDFAYANGDE